MSATATATSSPFRQLPSPLSDDHHQHQHHYRPSDKEESRESKRAKRSGRQSSEAEEVEAGLALAGMGMPVSEHDGQEGARKDKVMAEKKTKKEKEKEVKKEKGDDKDKDEKTVKPEGQGKKSCSECRRLKAKCDRVFPCSNCEYRSRGTSTQFGDDRCIGDREVDAQAGEEAAQPFVPTVTSAACKASDSYSPLQNSCTNASLSWNLPWRKRMPRLLELVAILAPISILCWVLHT